MTEVNTIERADGYDCILNGKKVGDMMINLHLVELKFVFNEEFGNLNGVCCSSFAQIVGSNPDI